MVLTKKPDSITVVIINRKSKKSKSFTVYGTLEDVFRKVKQNFK